MEMPKRPYELRERRREVEATRRRILDAALVLYASVGPAGSTISAVAREAGVQRLTVYRHFPDEGGLAAACLEHHVTQHPLPDQREWLGIRDPDERLRLALDQLYAYWEEHEAFVGRVRRDVEALPEPVAQALGRPLAEMREILAEGRSRRSVRRRTTDAAIGHALAFETWRSLVRVHGLAREEAVDLMAALVARS